jgi:hypothetical protein
MLELREQETKKIAAGLQTLEREFADRVDATVIARIGDDELERVLEEARIPDFVPMLVYRFTRERLLARRDGERVVAA